MKNQFNNFFLAEVLQSFELKQIQMQNADVFINAPDLLDLLSRNILKTSDIKYKKLYDWIYTVIVNVPVYFIHWKTTK